ncbi:MAG TPA: thiamine pyrophosphate-dependent enzyme, partial [Terriglobales bacterium]|nr:thiamine pyrophosphate-dependent enzyme [Terriglobales bacterium]
RDRIPHIWCSGCGLGTSLTAFVEAMKDSGIPLDKISVVSGIGCSGRISGYTDCDSFHTTHGRAIPFAIGLQVAKPALKVVVFSGDGDLIAIGGNHLIHAARRNANLTVFCVNNFNYGMTGGQYGATTQTGARTTTTPYGNVENSFNLPLLLASAGATYVARWTILDLGRLRKSMVEAIQHVGFSFVEIISPCPIYYARFNKLGDALSELKRYRESTEVRNFAPLEECGLTLRGKIVVGTFVDRQAPTLTDLIRSELPQRAHAAAS